MNIPSDPNLNYISVVLFFLGVFLFISGINIIKIERITITHGFKSWFTGLLLIIISIIISTYNNYSIKKDNKIFNNTKRNHRVFITSKSTKGCDIKSNFYMSKNSNIYSVLEFNTNNETLISSDWKISIWSNKSSIVIPDGWIQATNYTPSAGKYELITNEKPSRLINIKEININDPLAIIKFDIKYMYKGDNNDHLASGFDYMFNKINGKNRGKQINLGDLSMFFDTNTITESRHCVFIYYKKD